MNIKLTLYTFVAIFFIGMATYERIEFGAASALWVLGSIPAMFYLVFVITFIYETISRGFSYK